jgi:hypothetical protein
LYCGYGELGQVLFMPDGRVSVATEEMESAVALLGGSALAIWLVANQQLVLHASAVAWDDLAIAIVGGSHAGKTTLAAQCVLAGARLLADDVLRIVSTNGASSWWAGVRWLRLRSGASALLSSWDGPMYQSERDQRWVAISQDAAVPASGRLDALVFPVRSDDGRVRVTPRGQAEALRRLLLVPRVRGLQAHDLLRVQLRRNAELAREVPSVEVATPVGPPFEGASTEALHHDLVQLLGATTHP